MGVVVLCPRCHDDLLSIAWSGFVAQLEAVPRCRNTRDNSQGSPVFFTQRLLSTLSFIFVEMKYQWKMRLV